MAYGTEALIHKVPNPVILPTSLLVGRLTSHSPPLQHRVSAWLAFLGQMGEWLASSG